MGNSHDKSADVNILQVEENAAVFGKIKFENKTLETNKSVNADCRVFFEDDKNETSIQTKKLKENIPLELYESLPDKNDYLQTQRETDSPRHLPQVAPFSELRSNKGSAEVSVHTTENFPNERKKVQAVKTVTGEQKRKAKQSKNKTEDGKEWILSSSIISSSHFMSNVQQSICPFANSNQNMTFSKRKTYLKRTYSEPNLNRKFENHGVLFPNSILQDTAEKAKVSCRIAQTLGKVNEKYDKLNENITKLEEIGGRVGLKAPTVASVIGGGSSPDKEDLGDGGKASNSNSSNDSGGDTTGSNGKGSPLAAVTDVAGKVSGDQALKMSSLVSILALGATIVLALNQINESLKNEKEWKTELQSELVAQLVQVLKLQDINGKGRYSTKLPTSVYNDDEKNDSEDLWFDILSEDIHLLQNRQNYLKNQIAIFGNLSANIKKLQDHMSLIENRIEVLQNQSMEIMINASMQNDIQKQSSLLIDEMLEDINKTKEKAYSSDTRCPSMGFNFPRPEQVLDYVRYRGFIVQMRQMTTCLWMKTNDFDKPVLVSYATTAQDNSITLTVVNTTCLRLSISGTSLKIAIPSLADAEKNHICATFSRQLRQVKIYLNGVLAANKTTNARTIGRGGDLILGQDQDLRDAQDLDPEQAFRGTIWNFMIWSRVLRVSEIRSIASSCVCPQDFTVTMDVSRIERFGMVSYSIPSVCPVL